MIINKFLDHIVKDKAKIYCHLAFLCLLPQIIFSQINVYQAQVDSLFQAAQSHRYTDQNEAIKFASRALEVAEHNNITKAFYKIYNELAFNNRLLRNSNVAIDFSRKASKYAETPLEIGTCYESFGSAYNDLGLFDSAVHYLDKAYNHWIHYDIKEKSIMPLVSLGIISQDQGQIEETEKFYLRAYHESMNLGKGAVTIIPIAMLLEFYKNSDQPSKYAQIFDDSFEKLSTIEWEKHAIYETILSADIIENDQYISLVLDNHLERKRWKFLASTLTSIAKHFDGKKTYKEAYRYLELYENKLPRTFTPATGELYLWKYKIEKNLNKQVAALASIERHIAIKDSLVTFASRTNIEKLNVQYETLKKEQEIMLVDETNKRLWIGLILSSLLLLSVIIGLMSHSKKKRLISQQEINLRNSQIRDLEQKNKILGLSSLIEGQEGERIRIAKDLHDGLGGLLSSVKAHYGKIQKELKVVKEMKVLDRAQSMMDEAVDEVRRISHDMMPPMLRTNGLSEALKSYLENVTSSHDLALVLDIRNMEGFKDENKSLFIYRIIQELANNVVKHAEATEIQLQMIRLVDQIQIIFEDDGKGFEYHPDNLSGVGLRSIKSRVDYLGGEVDFDSKIGEGTVVEMSVPLV